MLIGMLNCKGLWISIFISRLFLRGHLCFRCGVILTNRKIYRQLKSASQSKRKRGKSCLGEVWCLGSTSQVWFTQRNAGRQGLIRSPHYCRPTLRTYGFKLG